MAEGTNPNQGIEDLPDVQDITPEDFEFDGEEQAPPVIGEIAESSPAYPHSVHEALQQGWTVYRNKDGGRQVVLKKGDEFITRYYEKSKTRTRRPRKRFISADPQPAQTPETEAPKQKEIPLGEYIRSILTEQQERIALKISGLEAGLRSRSALDGIKGAIIDNLLDVDDSEVQAVLESQKPRQTANNILSSLRSQNEALHEVLAADDLEGTLGKAIADGKFTQEAYANLWQEVRDRQTNAQAARAREEEVDDTLRDLDRINRGIREEEKAARELTGATIDEVKGGGKRRQSRPRQGDETDDFGGIEESRREQIAREVKTNPNRLQELLATGQLSRNDVMEIQAHIKRYQVIENTEREIAEKISKAQQLRESIFASFHQTGIVDIKYLRALRSEFLEIQGLRDKVELLRRPVRRQSSRKQPQVSVEPMKTPALKDRIEHAKLFLALDEMIEQETGKIVDGASSIDSSPISELYKLRDYIREPGKEFKTPSEIIEKVPEEIRVPKQMLHTLLSNIQQIMAHNERKTADQHS